MRQLTKPFYQEVNDEKFKDIYFEVNLDDYDNIIDSAIQEFCPEGYYYYKDTFLEYEDDIELNPRILIVRYKKVEPTII